MWLTLIRGLPGSGKSSVASMFKGYIHLETDQFWGPNYEFDRSRLGEAHAWCQAETRKWLLEWRTSVVVSNTFTTKEEMAPYFAIAKEAGIVPQVILCQGQWNSIHKVPADVIERMADRFEYDISDLYESILST